jgi:hypothetical protein
MIARYKRTARTFEELDVGEFAPLDEAIPEFSLPPLPRDCPTDRGSSGKTGRPQRDTQVNGQVPFSEISPVCDIFPGWLGGMTQEEAGLTLTLVARA